MHSEVRQTHSIRNNWHTHVEIKQYFVRFSVCKDQSTAFFLLVFFLVVKRSTSFSMTLVGHDWATELNWTVCAGYFTPWTNYQVLNLEKKQKDWKWTPWFISVESFPTHPLPPARSYFLSLHKLMEDGYKCMPLGAHSSILTRPPSVCVEFTREVDASNRPLSMCGGLLAIMMVC